MARAPSSTRSRSWRVTSRPLIAHTPSETWLLMWLPATPAYTVLISTPAMVWAASIASRMDRTVHSMLLTTPLRRPRQGTLPTPRIVMPSASTSPTTAETFVVPRSSPTTISLDVREDFMVVQRLRFQFGKRFETRPTLPCTVPQGQILAGALHTFVCSSCTNHFPKPAGWSSHPHHDALGMGEVIQEDDARSAAFFAQFADHFVCHEQLLAPRAGAEFERHAVFAAGQGDVAGVGQMHLFRRVNAAQRDALELPQDFQAGLDALDFALSVALQVLGRGPADQRHVVRIAGRDFFEGHAFRGHEVQAFAQGHDRGGFALAEFDAQGAGQAPGHFDLGDPGIFQQFPFGGLGVEGEDVLAHADPGVGFDLVERTAFGADEIDRVDRKARAGEGVMVRAPGHGQ